MSSRLPNLLTVLRVFVIVPVVALLAIQDEAARLAATALFALACLTDYFDGYLARKLNAVSAFGRFLDPIADKLLVAAVLLMLAWIGDLAGLLVFAAMAILLREIFVSGLREYLGGTAIVLPVSQLAKWKTAVQMVALLLLLIAPAAPFSAPIETAGAAALWLAALLTLITGVDYFRIALGHMRAGDAENAP